MYPVLSGGGGQIKKYVYVVLYEEIQMKKNHFLTYLFTYLKTQVLSTCVLFFVNLLLD